MSHSDAMQFPLIASGILFSLFLAFKYLDESLVNMVLAVYFGAVGSVGIGDIISTVVRDSDVVNDGKWHVYRIRIPLLGAWGAGAVRRAVCAAAVRAPLPLALPPRVPLCDVQGR